MMLKAEYFGSFRHSFTQPQQEMRQFTLPPSIVASRNTAVQTRLNVALSNDHETGYTALRSADVGGVNSLLTSFS